MPIVKLKKRGWISKGNPLNRFKPRFEEFIDHPNYMRLVNETRRSSHDTPVLTPVFNTEYAKKDFDEFTKLGGYEGNWYLPGTDVDKEVNTVASDIGPNIDEGKLASEVEYGFNFRRNVNVEQAAKDIEAGRFRKANKHGKADMLKTGRMSIKATPNAVGKDLKDLDFRKIEARHGKTKFSLKSAQPDQKYLDAVKQLGDTDELRNILQTAIKNNTLGKAPNGKQSNLEPAQWLMVRTKQFKDWFGDWEYVANAYPKNRAQGRNEVKAYIDSLKGKTLVSLEENIEAKLSKDGRSKIISDAALNKSLRNGFTISNHFTAVANLEELFKNSIRTNIRKDDGNNDSLITIEHFSAPIVFQKEPSLVTFTVKVTRDYGRKIYSIELMELKKVEGKVQSELDKIHKATSTFDTLNISKIADTVNNCSKVVDENGEPLVVYHGTNGSFNEYQFGRKSKRYYLLSDVDVENNAAFFAPTEEEAREYGKNVKKVFLNIKSLTMV